MSKQSMEIVSIKGQSIENLNVKSLKVVLAALDVKRVSKLRKAQLVRLVAELHVASVDTITEEDEEGTLHERLVFKFNAVESVGKKVSLKHTNKALLQLTDSTRDAVMAVMAEGVSLHDIVSSPAVHVDPKFVPELLEFDAKFNVSKVKVPTRLQALTYSGAVFGSRLEVINGEKNVFIEPTLDLRPQNHITDVLVKNKVSITRDLMTGEIKVLSKEEAELATLQGQKVQQVLDMRYLVSMDLNMPVLHGEEKLTQEQVFIQSRALINGVFFNFGQTLLQAKYMMASPSQERTLNATFIVGADPVQALHNIGMDFRQFAKAVKKDGQIQYVIDMLKAPKRFGLSLTSSVPSELVQIGNRVVDLPDGSFALVGGTHSMLCTDDVYSYVKQGKYLAWDPKQEKMMELDASEVEFERNVTDGMTFVDASVQHTLAAEFGEMLAGEQVRITPATKTMIVFVPGLKDMSGYDIVAFESATKGNYRTLLRTNPDYKIEFRVATFAHTAKASKKVTNIPYQMVQTALGHEHMDDIRAKLDAEMESVFEMYDNPDKLADYFGTRTVAAYDSIASADLTDEQRQHLDETLISMFANYFHAGEFVMNDPYFKKRILDLIMNMLKAWTRGGLPVDGHYRFVSTDVYAVMQSLINAKPELFNVKNKHKLVTIEKDNSLYTVGGKTVVPSHVGIQPNEVVAVDDNDEYFWSNVDLILMRNPLISGKEIAKVKAVINSPYFFARKLYPAAFNNLIFMSCHDFQGIRQGGLDFDGDKSIVSRDPLLLKGYKETPALLDVTYLDGKFIEGCPFQPSVVAEFDFFGNKYRSDVIVDGVQFNDEFKVTFTDADYNIEFARQLHELGKVFALRSLVPNLIGQLTDFATKILSAISRLDFCIGNNVTVDGQPLDERTAGEYEDEIAQMTYYVDVLRLLQGWEIDKPKHGGAFWDALEDELRFITDEDFFPKYASENYEYGQDKKMVGRRYSQLEWHKASKSFNSMKLASGQVYPSLMQEIRSHVLLMFGQKAQAKFNLLDPTENTDNLIFTFAPHANLNDQSLIPMIQKRLVPIFVSYGNDQRAILAAQKRFIDQRPKKFNSKREEMLYDRKMDFVLKTMREKAIHDARAKCKAFPFEPATVAYVAYAMKYREFRPGKVSIAASGLSFPWVVLNDGMLELVARVSGKSTNHLAFDGIQSVPRNVAIVSFDMAVDKVAQLLSSNQRTFVWYHTDEVTGNYMPFVYVGSTRIGTITEDDAYYFTGSDKFEFARSEIKISASGRSIRVTLNNSLGGEGVVRL